MGLGAGIHGPTGITGPTGSTGIAGKGPTPLPPLLDRMGSRLFTYAHWLAEH